MTKTKPINWENVNKYLTRLRDPNSVQAKYKYVGEYGGFCAIGHLMDLISGGKLTKDNQHNYGFSTQAHYLGMGAQSEAWPDIATRVSIYNDCGGYTMPQLADYIEGRLEEYLKDD